MIFTEARASLALAWIRPWVHVFMSSYFHNTYTVGFARCRMCTPFTANLDNQLDVKYKGLKLHSTRLTFLLMKWTARNRLYGDKSSARNFAREEVREVFEHCSNCSRQIGQQRSRRNHICALIKIVFHIQEWVFVKYSYSSTDFSSSFSL